MPVVSGPVLAEVELFAQGIHDSFDDMWCVQPGDIILHIRAVMVDEEIRKAKTAEFEPIIQEPLIKHELSDMGAKAADGAFLYGDQHFVVLG